MNKIFNIKKSEKGAVTTLVLVTVLVFAAILSGIYITVAALQKSQLKSDLRIQEIYQADVDNIDEIYDELINKLSSGWNEEKGVNAPRLLAGMTPIKFNYPTDSTKGTMTITNVEDQSWYQYGTTYETRRWANAETEDGSMWVWIPRFAYKITYTDSSDKSKGGTIDVKFLIGTTDTYFDDNGQIKTAQRQKTTSQTIDTTADYTVHPAFTNESAIDFANGGWDKELTGIWVAKFEAGYASGNNSAEVKASSINYENAPNNATYKDKVYVRGVERPRDNGNVQDDDWELARNWLDGKYGTTTTAIKYPVFQPLTYAMNYINTSDAFNLLKVLTESGNIYGLNSVSTDSHLMKDSEWGAVAYLSKSQYGNPNEITINNANLNSGNVTRPDDAQGGEGVYSVYAVTGCTSNSTTADEIVTTIESLNNVAGNTSNVNGLYVWNQRTGQNASTTGTIYGVYDMSGGTWERTAGIISNGNNNLATFAQAIKTETGATIAGTGTSTKYAKIYLHTDIGSTNNEKSQANFDENTKIYGDAIRETSKTGYGGNSWNKDRSYFIQGSSPVFVRGGYFVNGSEAGAFSYNLSAGYSRYSYGIRAVLVAK